MTLAAVRSEVATCIVDSHVSIIPLLRSCPLLNACFDEALRLVSAASSAHTVLSSTETRGKNLQEGTKLLLPYRQLHFHDSVFGDFSVDEFHPERFLDKEDLTKSTSFKPFGGGVTYCSRHFIARRQVLAFVALVIGSYDLVIEKEGGGKGGVPQQDEQKPTLGVIGPVKGDDLILRVEKRKI